MAQNFIPYRLGLDIGTNSIGFALIALHNGLPHKPLHMGVRIFSDGREAKTGTSLAVARRTARGMRRRNDRTILRQNRLIQQLVEYGLMPHNEQERKALANSDPYLFRKRGLDEQLTPHELGRALFHINQRRGFKSNRKQTTKDDDAGAIKEGVKKLQALLMEKNYRTIGEFLYHNPQQKRVRGTLEKSKTIYDFYPQRDMLEAEYDALISKQCTYHPNLLIPAVQQKLKNTIFYQRPLKPVQKGRCSLIPNEERAYVALPSSQRFRILKEVNNLQIVDALKRNNRNTLTDEQRNHVIEKLYKHKTVSFDGLRKTLKLDTSISFNLESEQRKDLKGASTHLILSTKECFGDLWGTLSFDTQDEIVKNLLDNQMDDETLSDWLRDNHPNLSDAQVNTIILTPLEESTLRYSTQAIQALLPHLEKGLNEYEAREECRKAGLFTDARGYDGQILDTLPYYGELLETHVAFGTGKPEDPLEKRVGRIPNPTVHVALNQLQKLVNELIKTYGKPIEIAVELSRSLKLTEKEKKQLEQENKRNQDANRKYDEQIQSAGLVPSDEYRLRLKLYEQQNHICAYSGKPLLITQALSAETEIDHILPFSRTLDDTSANKVLVLREYNRIKGNRSPYEAKHDFERSGIHYDQMLAFIPNKKRWRFAEDAMARFEEERQSGDKGWLARQLTDTSYTARVAREYLRYIVGDVDTYPGGMTAKLRHAWGFNSLLNPKEDKKNREDHRHHAVDALVIACSNRSMLQAISKASGKGEHIDQNWLKRVPSAFSTYTHNDLQDCINKIVISHKPDHGAAGVNGQTSGQLHEETFYGHAKDRQPSSDEKMVLVVRRKLSDLKEKDIPDIRDSYLRNQLAQFIYEKAEGESFDAAIARFSEETGIRRIRMLTEKTAKLLKAINNTHGKPYRYVATGSNHHIDIYCPIKDNKDLKIKAGKWYAEVVSTFDANQKNFQPQWRQNHPTAKLLMRLHINDMVAYEENGKKIICRVKKVDGASQRVVLTEHSIAHEEGDKLSWTASAAQLQLKNARKIAITPAGRVLDPGKAPMPKIKLKKADAV